MRYTRHLSPAQKTNAALTDVCRLLLDEWELTPEQIANLAKDIPGECQNMADNAAEAAWCAQQERLMESGGPDNSAYRREVIAAGRWHLINGSSLGRQLRATVHRELEPLRRTLTLSKEPTHE